MEKPEEKIEGKKKTSLKSIFLFFVKIFSYFLTFFHKRYCNAKKSVIYYDIVEYTVELRVGFPKDPLLIFEKLKEVLI